MTLLADCWFEFCTLDLAGAREAREEVTCSMAQSVKKRVCSGVNYRMWGGMRMGAVQTFKLKSDPNRVQLYNQFEMKRVVVTCQNRRPSEFSDLSSEKCHKSASINSKRQKPKPVRTKLSSVADVAGPGNSCLSVAGPGHTRESARLRSVGRMGGQARERRAPPTVLSILPSGQNVRFIHGYSS